MPPHRRPGCEVGGGVLDCADDALALAEAQLGPASRPLRPARMQGSELGGQGALTVELQRRQQYHELRGITSGLQVG